MYLPSRYEDEGRLTHLMFFEDVSGSITDHNIVRFNSELHYVWNQFAPKRMTVVQFDTIIQKVDELKEGDPFTKIEITGRGGTSLVCVRDLLIKERPTGAIIFSDMQVTPMESLPFDIPILWVAEGRQGHVPKFGRTIYIPRESKGPLR